MPRWWLSSSLSPPVLAPGSGPTGTEVMVRVGVSGAGVKEGGHYCILHFLNTTNIGADSLPIVLLKLLHQLIREATTASNSH